MQAIVRTSTCGNPSTPEYMFNSAQQFIPHIQNIKRHIKEVELLLIDIYDSIQSQTFVYRSDKDQYHIF